MISVVATGFTLLNGLTYEYNFINKQSYDSD